jgi:cytochrome c oxidase cbb3-type subunit 3
MKLWTALRNLVPLTLLCLLSACEGGSTPPPASNLPPPGEVAAVPLGQPAGEVDTPVASALSTANPYAGNPQAVVDGKALYIKMNCATCHAYTGKGNMGPDLTDAYWRYGGLPIQIYQSIHDGRPQGMPAWGNALPPQEIWKLVAYIQSFGGSVPVSSYREARLGASPGEQVAPELLPASASSRQREPR